MSISSLRVLLVGRKELDEEAFRLLYEEHVQAVYNYVAYRLGHDAAEDITAEIFLKVWAKRSRFDGEKGPLKAWLWSIVRHVVIDHFRMRRPILVPLPEGLTAASKVSAEVERREEWRRIRAALAQLDDVEQEIVALRFGAGETNRSIAAIVGMKEAAVAQRLRRALRKMRLFLEER